MSPLSDPSTNLDFIADPLPVWIIPPSSFYMILAIDILAEFLDKDYGFIAVPSRREHPPIAQKYLLKVLNGLGQ